jgi:hypothetical protein
LLLLLPLLLLPLLLPLLALLPLLVLLLRRHHHRLYPLRVQYIETLHLVAIDRRHYRHQYHYRHCRLHHHYEELPMYGSPASPCK